MLFYFTVNHIGNVILCFLVPYDCAETWETEVQVQTLSVRQYISKVANQKDLEMGGDKA